MRSSVPTLLCLLLTFGCELEPKAPSQRTLLYKTAAATAQPVVHVAAAADLSRAFEELGRRFETNTQQKVVFSFGSTGLLAKQIREGAPYDLFAAANVSFVTDVVRAEACERETQAAYARGRIVTWSAKDGVKPAESLGELADARFQRIAIANPEHAPYGKAAKQALQKLGVWQAVESRIVYGENVKQTLQFAQSGNAEAAIVALSLVTGSSEGRYGLIEETLHEPIDQVLVVCKNGKNFAAGAAFARFVNGTEGRLVMRRYGFMLPGETLVQAP